MPILSNFGGPLQISEQVDDCYQLAIRSCLKLIDSELPIASNIAELLLHFDNDTDKLEALLSSLLRQREQWIGDVVGVASSPQQALDYLTENLFELVEESMNEAASLLQHHVTDLMPLLDYATQNLIAAGSDSDLVCCAGMTELPDSDPSQLENWDSAQWAAAHQEPRQASLPQGGGQEFRLPGSQRQCRAATAAEGKEAGDEGPAWHHGRI